MTRDDFINAATPMIRQGITLVSGLLAAKGFTAAGNSMAEWAVSGSLLAASLGWALVEKSKLLASVVNAAPTSDLDALLATVQQFRAQGVSPLLVAHLAQTAAALAVAETQALAAPPAPAAVAPPADAVVPPPQVSPGVTTAPAGSTVDYGDGVMSASNAPQPVPTGATVLNAAPAPGPFGVSTDAAS